MLTYEKCHKLFNYKCGKLYRKITVSSNSKKGEEVGCNREGYLVVRVEGVLHRLHRIIYLMFNKVLPDIVDHIDNDPCNNLINNLRPATKSGNSCNSKLPTNNTSGIKGVSWDRSRKRWRGYVTLDGKQYHVGRFETLEEAKMAVSLRRKELHKEFGREQ